MKKFIKETIKEKLQNDETPMIDFRTLTDDIGHIQFDTDWGSDCWAIFFNGRCVHTSKTINAAVNKLEKLGVGLFDFLILESEEI